VKEAIPHSTAEERIARVGPETIRHDDYLAGDVEIDVVYKEP
jgi:hypothetical protein